jgi:hypothetical protein
MEVGKVEPVPSFAATVEDLKNLGGVILVQPPRLAKSATMLL